LFQIDKVCYSLFYTLPHRSSMAQPVEEVFTKTFFSYDDLYADIVFYMNAYMLPYSKKMLKLLGLLRSAVFSLDIEESKNIWGKVMDLYFKQLVYDNMYYNSFLRDRYSAVSIADLIPYTKFIKEKNIAQNHEY